MTDNNKEEDIRYAKRSDKDSTLAREGGDATTNDVEIVNLGVERNS
jgi:hypothetical protein